MTHDFHVRPSRQSGSVLAATIVLSVGTVGGAIFTGVATQDAESVMYCVGGGVAAIFTLLWFSTSRAGGYVSEQLGYLLARHQQDSLDYHPEQKRPKSTDYGTHRPPTVEEVRELKENTNTWVPAQKSARRERRDR